MSRWATRTCSRPNAASRPEVDPGAAAGLPPPRTPDPCARAAVLAGAAADPGGRTPHRKDLAGPGPRAGPAAPGHPDRSDRLGHPDHRAQHRQASILRACELTAPPRITALHPA